MDWKQKLPSTQDAGEKASDRAADAAIEQYWPKVQQLFLEKVGPVALAAAKNDQAMTSLFKTVYSVLPFPVRMVVKEDVFTTFCLNHRTKLLPPSEPTESAS